MRCREARCHVVSMAVTTTLIEPCLVAPTNSSKQECSSGQRAGLDHAGPQIVAQRASGRALWPFVRVNHPHAGSTEIQSFLVFWLLGLHLQSAVKPKHVSPRCDYSEEFVPGIGVQGQELHERLEEARRKFK